MAKNRTEEIRDRVTMKRDLKYDVVDIIRIQLKMMMDRKGSATRFHSECKDQEYVTATENVPSVQDSGEQQGTVNALV